jgi:hypothetical protein
MHFVGLNIGLRFNTIRQEDPTGNKPAKKKREYKNPEEEE